MSIKSIQCIVCGSYLVERNDNLYHQFTCKKCESQLYIDPATSEQITISELMQQLGDYASKGDAAALTELATRLKTQLPSKYLVDFYYQLSVNRISGHGDERRFRDFLSTPNVAPCKEDIDVILPILFRFSYNYGSDDSDNIIRLLESGKVVGLDDKSEADYIRFVHKYKDEYLEKIKNVYARHPRDVFICHANRLDAFATTVADNLESRGISCWYDHRNLPETTQDDYVQRIREQITNCKIFLLIAQNIEDITINVQNEMVWSKKREHLNKPVFIVGYFVKDSGAKNNVWDHEHVKHIFSMESSQNCPELAHVWFNRQSKVIEAVVKRYQHSQTEAKQKNGGTDPIPPNPNLAWIWKTALFLSIALIVAASIYFGLSRITLPGSTDNTSKETGSDPSSQVVTSSVLSPFEPSDTLQVLEATVEPPHNIPQVQTSGTVQEPITFPSNETELMVREQTGISKDTIYPDDVAGVLSLTLNRMKITDISFLQHFFGLDWLSLSDNAISDIRPLQNLTSLSVLNLQYNKIHDVAPLQSLFKLSDLDLSDNVIVDVMPLQNIKNLENLNLDSNPLSAEQINRLQKQLPSTIISFSD